MLQGHTLAGLSSFDTREENVECWRVLCARKWERGCFRSLSWYLAKSFRHSLGWSLLLIIAYSLKCKQKNVAHFPCSIKQAFFVAISPKFERPNIRKVIRKCGMNPQRRLLTCPNEQAGCRRTSLAASSQIYESSIPTGFVTYVKKRGNWTSVTGSGFRPEDFCRIANLKMLYFGAFPATSCDSLQNSGSSPEWEFCSQSTCMSNLNFVTNAVRAHVWCDWA